MNRNIYLKEINEGGQQIIAVCQVGTHTEKERIEISSQAQLFEIFDKYDRTPSNYSLWDLIQIGYLQEAKTVVGIGRSGTKSHIARVTYRERNGRKQITSISTSCGSQRWGSGIRTMGAVIEPTAANVSCKKCAKGLN